jgi:hypothetical protein
MQVATLRAKYAARAAVFTERSRRVWAAAEAQAIGYGGIALVARATGMAESTTSAGAARSAGASPAAAGTQPARGWRTQASDRHRPDANADLDALVEPTAPGDPASPLRWTSKSVRTLAVALEGLGHHVSHTVVAELLHALGYSLQGRNFATLPRPFAGGNDAGSRRSRSTRRRRNWSATSRMAGEIGDARRCPTGSASTIL